jgi:UDP-N-acetylglucosamine diphosphorylase/glucosamine-1-phosphate N-acetyltransferase
MFLLYDTPASRLSLRPLSLTRPLAHLRSGIFTLAEKWACFFGETPGILSEDIFQLAIGQPGPFYCVDASVWPTEKLATAIMNLQPGECLKDDVGLLAYFAIECPIFGHKSKSFSATVFIENQDRIDHIIQLIAKNAREIIQDYSTMTKGRLSASPSSTNTLIGSDLFIEEGVTMEACVLNTKEGPIYIGRNAYIMEGTCIRGPVSIGKQAVVKMGATLYGGTTIGPACIVGGEVKNSVLLGYSNKAHGGYLGDSYLGEWCNLGAGTSNSNLKNTAGEVKVWNYATNQPMPAGNKCGVIMGDYCRTAINTSLSTGTTVGICSSLHDAGLSATLIPSFQWGKSDRYRLEAALQDIHRWKQLKKHSLSEMEKQLLTQLYGQEGI